MREHSERLNYSNLETPLLTTGLPWIPVGNAGAEEYFGKTYHDQKGKMAIMADFVNFDFLRGDTTTKDALLAYMTIRSVEPYIMRHFVDLYGQRTQTAPESVTDFFKVIDPSLQAFDDPMKGRTTGEIHRTFFGNETLLQALETMSVYEDASTILGEYAKLYHYSKQKPLATTIHILKNRTFGMLDRELSLTFYDITFPSGNVKKAHCHRYITQDEKEQIQQVEDKIGPIPARDSELVGRYRQTTQSASIDISSPNDKGGASFHLEASHIDGYSIQLTKNCPMAAAILRPDEKIPYPNSDTRQDQ